MTWYAFGEFVGSAEAGDSTARRRRCRRWQPPSAALKAPFPADDSGDSPPQSPPGQPRVVIPWTARCPFVAEASEGVGGKPEAGGPVLRRTASLTSAVGARPYAAGRGHFGGVVWAAPPAGRGAAALARKKVALLCSDHHRALYSTERPRHVANDSRRNTVEQSG